MKPTSFLLKMMNGEGKRDHVLLALHSLIHAPQFVTNLASWGEQSCSRAHVF